jgi:hypothetical protein
MRIRYECPFLNRATGERRVVVVELAQHEIADVMYCWALRGPRGTGGPDGLIARGYALARANPPEGFSATDVVVEEMRRRPLPTLVA